MRRIQCLPLAQVFGERLAPVQPRLHDGFVGIVVPHMVRLVAGSSYRLLLPLSMFVGASFLILADIPGRVLQDPAETPIGVVTAFLGAPFFIVILRTRRTVS